MAKNNEKKKFLKKQQKKRRKENKENKVVEVISYDNYLKWAEEKFFDSEDWLLCEVNSRRKMEYLLNNLNPYDLLMMEDKLTEALLAVVAICEHLYSPLITSNQDLQDAAKQTMVNYYRNGFEIRKSAEISILPLELRLYIYIELLKREYSKYFLVNILDRIALTLKKMKMYKEYEAVAFVLSWAEMILFVTTEPLICYNNFNYEVFNSEVKKNKGFTSLLYGNDLATDYAIQKREELLDKYGVGIVDKVNIEFWYGVDIFCNREKIRDMDAAKISVELFCVYFKPVVSFAGELQNKISDYYSGRINTADLKNYVDSHRFDLINSMIISELYSSENIQSEPNSTCIREEWYSILQGKSSQIEYYDLNELAENISPDIFDVSIRSFLDRLENGRSFLLPNVEAYIMKLYAGVLISDEWNEDVKILILDTLNRLRGHMWENRDLFYLSQDIKTFFYNLLTTSFYKNMRVIGQGGNTIAFVCEDGLVMLRTERYDRRIHLSTKIMKNWRMDQVEEAFGRRKDMIISADLANRAFLPQNDLLPGMRLLETILPDELHETFYLKKRNMGIYREKNIQIRDADIESYLFGINSKSDSILGENREFAVIAQSDFEEDMKIGVQYYRNRQYVNAANCFLELLDKYPQNGILNYYIANSFCYMTDGQEYSLRFYREALKYEDFVEIWVDYGNTLRHMRRMEEAISVLEKARKRFPNDGSPATILTSIYKEKSLYKIVQSESIRKRSAKYNEIIREWESENQILKPIVEEFV